ncbi:MAG: efflux RND transporter periplasmic adaptor subunit [Thiothrix sp.]|nr:efflux RND transporter periplasmic adaptor subunit [Thiothrix sp.]HPQ94467.1 efflux RND transporter periplasmic adaptor subunit [Thiolinea sp.]
MNPGTSKQRDWRVLLVSVVCGSLLVGGGMVRSETGGTDAAATAADAKPALTVNVVKPELEDWAVNISADGAITPWQEAVIAAETGSLRLTDLLVDVGDVVSKGQELARLYQGSIEADMTQQKAVISQGEAGVAQAETQLSQARIAVAQAEAAVGQAQAGVQQAYAGVEQANAGVLQAEAGVSQANAGVVQANAGVQQANAGVVQANAGVVQANAQLSESGAGLQQAQASVAQANAGIAQANAGIQQAMASFNEAKANADRARKLKPTGALPLQQVDQYLTAEATARAGVENQKAALNAQKAALNAQQAGFNAKKSALEAQKANVEAKKAAISAQQAVVQAQKAGVMASKSQLQAQQAAVESSKAGVKAQRANVAVQQAAVTVREKDVDTQKAAITVQASVVEAQRAALKVQQTALESLQIRMDQTVIRAVDDGVISARSAALGMVVQPGTELFRMIRQNRLEWHAEVDSDVLGQIREGQPVSITLPTGEVVDGEVRQVSPELESTTRRALVYVSLPQGSSARAGMFVQGLIRHGSEDALTVPQTTVILRDGRQYVFVVGDDSHVHQTLVKTGRRMQDRVEILEGVETGARLVASGGAFLNDNDLVQLADGERGAGGSQ